MICLNFIWMSMIKWVALAIFNLITHFSLHIGSSHRLFIYLNCRPLKSKKIYNFKNIIYMFCHTRSKNVKRPTAVHFHRSRLFYMSSLLVKICTLENNCFHKMMLICTDTFRAFKTFLNCSNWKKSLFV